MKKMSNGTQLFLIWWKIKKINWNDTESKTDENQTKTHVCQILRCKTKTDVKGKNKNVKWTTQTLALFIFYFVFIHENRFLRKKRRKFCMAQNDKHNSSKDSVCMWWGKWWKIWLKKKNNNTNAIQWKS